ncbi:MAG TPA: hypothetical protein VKI44_13980 [Acetobacteraceae bacterium]|nr:hypothetical protein [Acetobacteraceae bacterium]
MSETRTVWHDLSARRSVVASKQRTVLLLGAGLLIAMCAAEVGLLSYMVGTGVFNPLIAADGAPVGGE